MSPLNTSISTFPTVTKPLLKRLHNLGLKTAEDLLFYFPFRYDDLRQTVPIAQLQPETRVTVRGKLELLANRRSFKHRRMMTEAMVGDATGQIKVVWFNQPYLIKNLKIGDKIYLAGKVTFDRYGLQMTNPVYEKERLGEETVHTARLVPIYPLTAGLTQKHLRFLIKKTLPLIPQVKEWLPLEIVEKFSFLDIRAALNEIHFPADEKNFTAARERFKFEELFLIQLRNESLRAELKQNNAPPIGFKEEDIKKFVEALPYKLTNDQRRSAWEIITDLGHDAPMNRLLNGDVGSGKTIVAAVAMYNAVLNGYQAALMAPTEILASQHFTTLSKLFASRKIKIGLILGGTTAKEKKQIINQLKKGEFDIIVGTHALIQESVSFANLGLTIVDEQHRFGVDQRKKLKEAGRKNLMPHFLSMTATPIPRSFALAVYGDLDLSLIKQMPAGRQKIITKLVDETNRQKAYDFIRQQIKVGRQAFVVCPLIERSGEPGVFSFDDRRSVKEEYEKLKTKIFPELNIAMLHGKLKGKDKDTIMKDFLAKKYDLLVSTSVVEVGVDIPNATIMMIEGADRFGLAQLHQFRGRVGRGSHQSYCLLFSNSTGATTKERLNYFVATSDGFVLAEKDLALRGPGELFGSIQHGFPELKMTDLKDLDTIKKAREAAREILSADPKLARHPAIKERLGLWQREVHLE